MFVMKIRLLRFISRKMTETEFVLYIWINLSFVIYSRNTIGLAESCRKCRKAFGRSNRPWCHFLVFHFYDSLAQLALFLWNPKNQQKAYPTKSCQKPEKDEKNGRYHAPMNYLHKWQLVEAERARVLGKDEKAIRLSTTRPSQAPRKNQYLQEEALANELAAKFYLEKGETDTARKYMTEARYCYDHWGAKAKVDHLDQNYPELLADVSAKMSQASTMTKTGNPAMQPPSPPPATNSKANSSI